MKLEIAEGWMAEKPYTVRRYHYIVGAMALCRGYGFYQGELTPATPGATNGREDCAECFKRFARRAPAPPPRTEGE